MKKIFWTTIFWIVAVSLFRVYVRLFNANMAQDVASLRRSQEEIVESSSDVCLACPICLQSAENIQSGSMQEVIKLDQSAIKPEVVSPQDDKFSSIQKQLDTLAKKLDEKQLGTSTISNTTKEIRLFLGDQKTPNAVITVSGARVEMGE